MSRHTNLPPVIGFSAFSGTGKTTLLKKIIVLLRERDIRLAVIKHAHHDFEIDHPGKDSFELRKADAYQMLISSGKRKALITEFASFQQEPSLNELIDDLDHENIDLILVEGFKREHFAKIELHRESLNK
ncbi:MAG: molybdopterin-guanine dinucleotide biosynthesis protein B, partial [Gammaproteobacteria bacterium]|nr:molybdopterin-guanine dinucleotide biosynthesis protein B [Gammaproteobacteria bacterium]